MIYVDTSVVLAELFAEDRCPPPTFWDEALASSRLVEYEIWNAIHRQRAERSHGEAARRIIESLAIAELSRHVLQRATEPFPSPVRTLDALHLSTLLFLRELGVEISLASYDRRMREAAAALGIALADC
jgi:predicted nucleic acid-binding protein